MYERLSTLDASLIELERPVTPLHTGGSGVFGPGLSFADVHDTLRTRLGQVPLARRRLHEVRFGGGLVWVDDTNFDLSYHLRHAALPAPGSSAQLGDFLSRLIARPLDRSRPLWELYVIEGLQGGRTVLFHKVHLAMAGGDRADPFAVLLDEEGGSRTDEPDTWRPDPEPSALELVVGNVRNRAEQAVHAGKAARRLATDPPRALGALAGTAGSALGLAARAARPAPRSPLNRPPTPHRRFATVRARLDDLRAVRSTFGGTINDAVVAVCADAVGRLLRWRGHDTTDLDLRVMVPVRVHATDDEDALAGARSLGEGAVGVLAPLPVMEMDPVARLYRIMGELAGLKESRQALAAERLATLATYAPTNLHALAARLVTGEQRYNVALSNAPGPQHRLWLGEAPLEESYPFIPLAGDAALSIAVTSYLGVLCFGLLGDRRAVPDLDRLAGFVDDAVETLVAAASADAR